MNETPNPTHTPGPWHVDENRGVMPKIRTRYDYPIATLALTDSPEETQANARLIAAAPTMADAIEAALNILEGAKNLDDALNAVPFLRDALNIAKATGAK